MPTPRMMAALPGVHSPPPDETENRNRRIRSGMSGIGSTSSSSGWSFIGSKVDDPLVSGALFPVWVRFIKNGLFHGSSVSQSVSNGLCADPAAFAPLRNAQCLPSSGNQTISSRISLLLLSRSPSAIPEKIPGEIVSTVNRSAFRGRAHIREEFGELHPFVANFNPPSSVVCKLLEVRIQASLLHAEPDSVLPAAGHPVLSVPARATARFHGI